LVKQISYSIILFLISNLCVAQESEIYGLLPDYAGTEFVFETYEDFITQKHETLGKTTVDSDGQFNFVFENKECRTVFLRSGIFRASIIIEPGKNYDIQLPQNTKKNQQELDNPFFEEIKILAYQKTSDSIELNNMRNLLSNEINSYLNKNLKLISLGRMRRQNVDTFVVSLEKKYPATENSEFLSYRKYKIGHLRYITYLRSMNIMAKKYFLNQPILYSNQDYMKLFNQAFDNFLISFTHGRYGKGLHAKIVDDKDLSSIKQHIHKNPSYANDTLIELLIIKGLYDGYYNGKYEMNVVIKLFESIITDSKILIHQQISSTIIRKLTKLAFSYPAPKFELLNSDSVLVSLDKYKGKYVYLNFCSSKNYSCKQDFVLLKDLKKHYLDKLVIISISVDNNTNEFFDYMKNNEFDWVCLTAHYNLKAVKDYRIKMIPTYYLIDPYGKMLLSPAVSPHEDFDNEFNRVLNNRD